MRSTQNAYTSQTYKSNTHRVVSRTPLSVGSYNSSTMKVRGVSNLNTYNDMTLKNRPVFESLNIEKRVYIYVDQVPKSNVIYYDSNLRKYRTLSEGLKNASNAHNSINTSNQRNFLDQNRNMNKTITQNNRYNQKNQCICDDYSVVKQSELEKMKNQSQRVNRTAYSTNTRSNINMSQNIRSNANQTSNSRNQASSLNENRDKRFHSQTNNVESRRETGRRNNNEDNQNRRGNNETRNSRQSNQGNKRDDKDKNKIENTIPLPQKGKVYQEDMISGRKKDNKDINATNARNNNQNSNLNQKLAQTNNYAPISINKSKEEDLYKTDKKIQTLTEGDFQQHEKIQSPYKNEEIIKDEKGEIIQKKEEKTIVILPGQTIEPKSVIETFEKPIIEVIQNEDGTSQSVFKQTKIITTMENIPINNTNAIKNGEEDLQLIKQIITNEYKTVSSVKDKLDKSGNKTKEENKEINQENITDKKNGINGDKKEENNDMNENKDDNKKNLRYMDIEKDDNSQNKNFATENKNNETENKNNEAENKNKEAENKSNEVENKNNEGENQRNEAENKKQTDTKKEAKEKSKNKEFNLKPKTKNTKEKADAKSKNAKTGLSEQQPAKKEKEKNLKEKSENEALKKKSGSSKAKDKKEGNKEKSSKESTNKESASNNKKGKNNEETNLKKSSKKNQKEEKETKTSDFTGNNKVIFELYEKCFKLGNKPDSDKLLEKIVELLIVLVEKERKDILSKLLKAFPKSSELNQKIIILINKRITKNADSTNKNKNKDNQKGKEKGNKLSLEKEIPKESRSKSQLKSGVKKNKLKSEEEANKSEKNKKAKKAEESSIKSPSKNSNISPIKLETHSVHTANIGNLNFDGLFLDISKYQSNVRYENPFRGPSSFYKFYKIRRTKIRKKLDEMTNEAKNTSEDKKEN